MSNSRIGKVFNKINAAIIFFVLLFITVAFDGAVIYGMNGSSLVAQEKYVYQTQKDAGKDIHIRFNLSSFSLASRLSLMSPVDDFNSYRIKEIGRQVSYVLNESFNVTYEDKSFSCAYASFENKYSNSLTVSRFLLPNGSFEDFDNKDVIYISTGFLANISGLSAKNAIGKKITLSLKEEKEYTIGGVVRTTSGGEAGLHFKTLFDGSFVLFNHELVKDFGFTDFINAYNKSYLSFNEARMKISSFKESEQIVTSVTSPRYKKTGTEDTYSFLTILTMVVVSLIYIAIMVFYDFQKVKRYIKIPVAGILTAYHFLTGFYLAKQILKKGLFVSKLSLTIFIGFMAVSLISYIFIFWLFNLAKKNSDEEQNNG